MQRSVVLLVHTFGYSLSETAALLGVAKGTAQTHIERGLVSCQAVYTNNSVFREFSLV
jgi:DNA-directed RNA polymerase specialized sigma24 family protein